MGGGLQSWEEVFTGVACGEVSRWVGKLLAKTSNLRLGVESRVKFWIDRWCGDLPLRLAFLVLYNIATNREASVDSSLIRQGVGDRRDWNVRFNRGPNDWEVELVDDSFWFLAANLPSTDDGDRMRWKLTKNGDLNICSFYHKLCDSFFIIFP